MARFRFILLLVGLISVLIIVLGYVFDDSAGSIGVRVAGTAAILVLGLVRAVLKDAAITRQNSLIAYAVSVAITFLVVWWLWSKYAEEHIPTFEAIVFYVPAAAIVISIVGLYYTRVKAGLSKDGFYNRSTDEGEV